jgi:hypothetical protein
MNLLIGGAGADRLRGGRLGDILVGGATGYDRGRLSDLLKLETILSVWTDGASFSARSAEISSAMPGGWNLNASLTSDPSAHDRLTATPGRDWSILPIAARPTNRPSASHVRRARRH